MNVLSPPLCIFFTVALRMNIFLRPFCVNCWGVCVGVGNTFETFAVDISANSKYFLLSLKKIKYPARRTLFYFFVGSNNKAPFSKSPVHISPPCRHLKCDFHIVLICRWLESRVLGASRYGAHVIERSADSDLRSSRTAIGE